MIGLTRARGTSAVKWRTIIGLALVPITAAGVLLWGLWSPTDRLDTVTAAVVNLDEPIELDGQTVPLGRVLAAELIAGDADTNFTWLLTDEGDASGGLDEGRYAAVVTIPENFSAAATSMSQIADSGANRVRTASIDIATSERGRLLDSVLSNTVIATATSVLNQQLGSQFVGGVFVGMTELGSGIGEAATGAQQLATGGAQLADGAAQLADGGTQLADGAAELAAGTAQLSGGVQQLADGTGELASGLGGFAAGTGELAQGARDSANGQLALSAGVNEYVGGINSMIDTVLPIGSSLEQRLADLIASIENGEIPFENETQQEEALTALRNLQTELGTATGQMQELRDGGTALAEGLAASAAGSVQIADGVAGLAGGATELATGASQLSSGMNQLTGQLPTLASGTAQLADGAQQSADGTQQLADGLRQAADGSAELADGLNLAASQIPSYSDAEIERISAVAVQPVEVEGAKDELFNAAGVPLFAGIALWAGAFASFLMLAPLWSRTRTAARGLGYITLRSAIPALLLGAGQGAIVGLVLPLLLGYDAAQGISFFALAVLAGISFTLVVQGLAALFGGIGRFIAFVLLAIAFAIGVISTAPPLLQAIGDGSPIGSLFTGFQAVAMGTSGAGIAAFALVVWGLGGLALTAFAVARARARA
ncbi:MAG: YhgE/Pip domain-containing protein [Leucobacter sp.]|nr:YhgE/Pip domain-containing protein [Leucobacter sp.]